MQLKLVCFSSCCLIVYVLSTYCCFAQSAEPRKEIPRTVDDAVRLLKSELSPSYRDFLLRMPRETAQARLHFGLGLEIRNRFKLWGGNSALMKSCGVPHPDNCSGIILDRLWDAVRAEADPKLVSQLDCQFNLAETIHIDYKGFDKATTGELLHSMQTQIDEQLLRLKSSGAPMCQDSLKLRVIGEPKLDCFVRAEFAKEGKTHAVTLQRFLGWIGFRNGFDAVHEPPAITLEFQDKCTWPKSPTWF